MNAERPTRRHPRLQSFDYSTAGAYFLTVCTLERKQILSRINVGRGVLDAPCIRLTEYGRLVESQLLTMRDFYENIRLDHYVIMPNHIHLLLTVSETAPRGASGTPRPTNSAVSRFVGTFKRFSNAACKCDLWQTGFYDHIIRDERDFIMHWRYIDDNPAKWTLDPYHP